MKLLYLRFADPNSLYKNTRIHFDSYWKFSEKGTEIFCTRTNTEDLPDRFFSVGNDGSPIEGVTAIVGKNGCGKTTLACFLKDIRGSGKHDYDFTLIYEGVLPCSNDKDRRYWIVHSYQRGEQGVRVRFAEIPKGSPRRERLALTEVPNYISLENFTDYVYFSPHFTTENPFRGISGDMVNLSTTGLFVQNPLSMYRQLQLQSGVKPDVTLSSYAFDERRRVLEFAAAFYQLSEERRKSVPFPMPLRVALDADEDTLQQMRRFFSNKRKELEAEKQALGGSPDTGYFDQVCDCCEKVNSVIEMASTCFLVPMVFITYVASHCSDWNLLGGYHGDEFGDAFGFEMVKVCLEKLSPFLHDDLGASDCICKELWRLRRKFYRRGREMEANYKYCTAALAFFLKFRKLVRRSPPRHEGIDRRLVAELSDADVFKFLREAVRYHRGAMLFSPAIKMEFGPAISSGEMAYLTLFGRLASHFIYGRAEDASRGLKKDVVVFVDEAETTLHPEWQQGLFWNLLWFFENFARDFRIHLIVSSHSPVFLSDIPAGHCVFLERAPSASGAEIQTVDVLKQARKLNFTNTFAANIFDLYYLPFFLRQGTIGRFAAGKLHQIQGASSSMDPKTRQKLIDLVGDTFVRNYLLHRQGSYV